MLSKKKEVQQIHHQPTRGLESYVGKIYREQDRSFPIHTYDSTYLQERSRREAWYNSIPFSDLYSRIKSLGSAGSANTYAEAVSLDARLAPGMVFFETTVLNPLDSTQKQKIISLFDFFKNSLQQKKGALEREWKEKERKIISLAIPLHYKKEEMSLLDTLTEEYLQWTSFSWLEGSFQMFGIRSLIDYGKVVQGLHHFEEKFWQPYLSQYQSRIFTSAPEVQEEKKYLHHCYQEQFTFSFGQIPLHLLRLQSSLPYQLLQEMDYVKNNLASCNEIKVFIKTKLQHLNQDKKNISTNGKSGDSLLELRSRYPSLAQQFPDWSGQLLYFGSLPSMYEQQREDFYKVLREQEISLEEQRTMERKSRDSCFSHPLVISLEPFDISAYVQRYAPSTIEMQNVKKILLGDDSWERKINQLSPLLDKKPSFYSERDKDFLHSVIFALETSQREGVLEHLCREKPALHQKIKGVLSKLEDYAQYYVLHS